MSGTVFYNSASELATLSVVFELDSLPADPGAVTLVVTNPDGVSTTYSYALAELTKTGTGAYTKDVPCGSTTRGLWSAVWFGTSPVVEVKPQSWTTEDTDQRKLYVPLDVLKDAVGLTSTTKDRLLVRKLASAASAVDDYCGRRFWRDLTATARTFTGRGRIVPDADEGDIFLVDDIATTTGLIVDTGTSAAWTTVTGYEPWPDNTLAKDKPIMGLRRPGVSSWGVSGTSRLRVTAFWGWPSVPDAVFEATLLMAQRLWRRKDSPEGVAGSSEFGAVRVARVDPDVAALLDNGGYVLPGFGG